MFAISTEENKIGIILGTEKSGPLEFWFAVQAGKKVQLDDIVYIEVDDPAEEGEVIKFYGVVDEVSRTYEGVQFDGDTELVAIGLMPANVSYIAHVIVTRVEPEDFIPPSPSDIVYQAVGETLEKALYLDNMDAPLPAGVLRNGEPGYINYDFVNGTKGAHINISGISGIATKTSYALFLLYSIFNAKNRNTDAPLLEKPQNTKAIIFNVKGEDLFFLDKNNKRYDEQEGKWKTKRKSEKSRYDICGLPTGPFESAGFHAPAMEGQNLVADMSTRDGVDPYLWSVHDFAEMRMLPFVLTDGDSMSNLGFLAAHVEENLFKLADRQKGPYLEVEAYSNFLDPDYAIEKKEKQEKKKSIKIDMDDDYGEDDFLGSASISPDATERIVSFDELVDFLTLKLLGTGQEDLYKDGDTRWTANQQRGTREAFIRRMRGAAKHVRRIIRSDLPKKSMDRAKLNILNSDKQIHVVDINKLAPLAQMFVVGVLLRQIFAEQETSRSGRGHIFIVLDELNKYAPSEGKSPIKDVLLDIAERGRSLGIVLIGAQQTASEVERRIVSNAAVRIVGRLDAAESERSEYRFMPATFRGRSTILAPGTMIVHQPDVPSPLMLNFPFPAWATRRDEVDDAIDASDDAARDVLGY